MGHDVHTIGKHNLDTSGIEALAKDISHRLNVNVEYGVYDTFWFDWDGFFREPSYKYWVFGKVTYPKAEKTLWLTDEFYTYHIVWERYGENAWLLPHFIEDKFNELELRDAINNVCFELRDNAESKDYVTFFNDTFHDRYNFLYNRWWGLCRTLTGESTWLKDWDDIYTSEFYKFRKEVRQFIKAFGANEVFYFDDQGETQYLTAMYYDWETILKEVEVHFKMTTLNVPDFMLKKEYLARDNYPLAFYDDFSDLEGV